MNCVLDSFWLLAVRLIFPDHAASSFSAGLNNLPVVSTVALLRTGAQRMDFSNEANYLFFSTLASHTRLAIIDVLREGPKGLAEISEALNLKQALVAENLEKLERTALVLSEGSGDEKRFAVNKEIIEPLSGLLEFHVNKYCPGLTECIPPEKLKEYMKKEAAKMTYIGRG
ncbi:MAG: winged helix-turn-helix domain-containing protein [Candidatus Bathyarchaeota archaeon]|nr:winged helix-turn-helix domain-containing protein [Candidatus Bathyarchaeota archaeon]